MGIIPSLTGTSGLTQAPNPLDFITWTDATGALNAIPCDVVINAKFVAACEPTKNPIEDGGIITDHIIQSPNEFTCEIMQTQTPIQLGGDADMSAASVALHERESQFKPGGLLAASTAIEGAIGGLLQAVGILDKPKPTTVQVLKANNPIDRAEDMHELLLSLVGTFLCTVVMRADRGAGMVKGRIIPSLLITNATRTWEAGKVGAGWFSLSMQTIRTVKTALAKLPSPADLRAKAAKKIGTKPPTPAAPAPAGPPTPPPPSTLWSMVH